MDSASEVSHLSIYPFLSLLFPLFCLLSGASTLAAAPMPNATASPQALSSSSGNGALLFGSENDATFWKEKKKREGKENC